MATSPARLRKLLAGGELIVAPGAFDPYTARLIESLDFPAVYMGGFTMGTHLCTGEPLTTLTETVDCALRALRAIEIPMVIDAGAGFGDATHAYRTVLEFERAGVAGLHIEDQVFPKRVHYHKGRGRVIPLDEMLEKLQAAIAARRDPDFVIIGRTDVLRVTHSMTDTLERLHAYREAGVDMLMVTGMTPETGAVLRRELADAPLVWMRGGTGPQLTTQQIADLGFQLAIYPTITPIVITDAVLRIYKGLRDEGLIGLSEESINASQQQMLELIGLPKYLEIEERSTERD